MAILLNAKIVSKDNKLDVFIIKAHNFEKNLFNKQNNSWFDNRFDQKSEDFRVWCHGSGEIGLSKLLVLNFEKSKDYEIELQMAYENISDLENINQS